MDQKKKAQMASWASVISRYRKNEWFVNYCGDFLQGREASLTSGQVKIKQGKCILKVTGLNGEYCQNLVSNTAETIWILKVRACIPYFAWCCSWPVCLKMLTDASTWLQMKNAIRILTWRSFAEVLYARTVSVVTTNRTTLSLVCLKASPVDKIEEHYKG